MEKNHLVKFDYETPVIVTLEINTEGVLCSSTEDYCGLDYVESVF